MNRNRGLTFTLGGLDMFIRILTTEVGPLAIHVVNVVTGLVGTEMMDAGGEMDDVPDGESMWARC